MLVLKSAFKATKLIKTSSNKVMALAIALLLCLSQAKAESVTQWQLKDLRTGKLSDVVQIELNPTLAMVFQPDCPWCKKQGSILAQFKQHCGQTVNVIMLGDRGHYTALRRELRKLPSDIPAYQTDPKFMRAIGGVEASPTLLFFDHRGELLGKKRGFTETATLTRAVQYITENKCQLTDL